MELSQVKKVESFQSRLQSNFHENKKRPSSATGDVLKMGKREEKRNQKKSGQMLRPSGELGMKSSKHAAIEATHSTCKAACLILVLNLISSFFTQEVKER